MKEKLNEKNKEFVFDNKNYKWMLIGLAFIIIGFILMSGGGSDDPAHFSEEIFNPTRLTIAPILVMTGFIIEIYAILTKSKTK